MQRFLVAHAYVHRRFDDVCRLLGEHPGRLLQGATDEAGQFTGDIVSELHVDVAGFEIGKTVRVEAAAVERYGRHMANLPLRWWAETGSPLFPTMEASLEVYPLSDGPLPLTQLAFVGRYRPPLWLLGALGDAVAGRKVAEATVHHFLDEVRQRIEHELSPQGIGRYLGR